MDIIDLLKDYACRNDLNTSGVLAIYKGNLQDVLNENFCRIITQQELREEAYRKTMTYLKTKSI